MLLIKGAVLTVFCFCTSISSGNIVDELRQRFNDVTNECFDAENNTQPAYKCSGLIIRGIRLYPEMKFAWSLKSTDKKKNAFSFSYLRRDHLIGDFGSDVYDAGFILYPHLKAPSHKSTPKVLCAFADVASSDNRADRGCGRHIDDETGSSEPCHTQSIKSVPQWMEHFDTHLWNSKLCGFKMTEETETQDFALALQVNSRLQIDTQSYLNTELRVAGWDEDDAKSIPIQAFFYYNTKMGHQNAIKYRDDFYAQSGELLPIVSIKLPNYGEAPTIHVIGEKTSN